MRMVFMGSPQIAASCLHALVACRDVEVAGVVTQPDRPRGRRLRVEPCDARRAAMELGLATYAAATVHDEAGMAQLREWAPELVVVVAFGQILRPAVLALPPLGCINLHTSLLPELRGAAPIQWAIAQGRSETGVTTMYMDAGMDTGDIILARRVAISPEDTGGSLHDKLAHEGAALLVETVDRIAAGTAPRRPQDHTKATYARKLNKADGRLDWAMGASELHNRIRAFNPWPCCQALPPGGDEQKGLLRVLASRVEEVSGAEPGCVVACDGEGPVVACGEGAIRLLEVQPPGKRRMSGSEYLRGHDVSKGDRFT